MNITGTTAKEADKTIEGALNSMKAAWKNLVIGIGNSNADIEDLMDDLKITDALVYVNEIVNRANKYIDETMPWVLAKDPNKLEELASVMNHLANSIYVAAMLYKPVLVTASDKAFDQLGVPTDCRGYDNVYKFGVLGGGKVNKGDPLFPRLDASVEVPFIKDLMGENNH